MKQKIEIVDYYACVQLNRYTAFSLTYQTTRDLSDHWGTKQSEPEYYLNGRSVSREELPSTVTAEIIAELIATASIVEIHSNYVDVGTTTEE